MEITKRLWNWFRATVIKRKTANPTSEFMQVAYSSPRQVVLLTARHAGAQNIWPIDWHIPLSFEPPLYAVSLTSTSYGASLVQQSGAFVVNFVPATPPWEQVIFFCGNNSGQAVDKFAATQLTTEPASTLNAPRLCNTLGFLECQVEQSMVTGDHTLFVGRIMHEQFFADASRLHHIYHELGPVAASFETTDNQPT